MNYMNNDLGTVFSHDLKLRQSRYAFYKFCSFGASESQKLLN